MIGSKTETDCKLDDILFYKFYKMAHSYTKNEMSLNDTQQNFLRNLEIYSVIFLVLVFIRWFVIPCMDRYNSRLARLRRERKFAEENNVNLQNIQDVQVQID